MSDDHKQPDTPQRLEEALALETLGLPLKRALEHRGRLELFIFLADRSDGKATSEQELSEAFGMGIRLVEYHLKVLEDAKLIASVADERGSEPTRSFVAAPAL
jgi:DNA-binding transcriptional ArsR family regulator